MNTTRQRIAIGVSTICLLGILSGQAFAQFRTIDGTGNNPNDFNAGAAGQPLLRLAPVDYADGTGQMQSGPNTRSISNAVFTQIGSTPNSHKMSSGVWQWGQFIDHDIAFVPVSSGSGTATIIPEQPDPDNMTMIPFNRSDFLLDGTNVRQQINGITSYLDASQIYGSDTVRAAALRNTTGGTLKTSAGSFLPLATQDAALGAQFMDDGGIGQSPLFVAGDVRANEQPGLTAMHTLFVREHNRIAQGLSGTGRTDDEIYETARRVVGAEIQAITYNEFLPALLGSNAPSTTVNLGSSPSATLLNEFSTAAFRLGHSMLNPELLMADTDGPFPDGLVLRDTFFRPQDVFFDGSTPQIEVLDQILMGLTQQVSQEIDAKIVDDVRSFLFTEGSGPGLDLAALNIQRGRDHGIPRYNAMRSAIGLEPAADYDEITSDLDLQLALESVYGADNVDDVDAFVGAMAEDHMEGGNVGQLVSAIVAEQFERLRDGDSFFYMRTEEQDFLANADILGLVDVNSISLAQIVAWNSSLSMDDMPHGFFSAIPEPLSGTLLALAIAIGTIIRRRR